MITSHQIKLVQDSFEKVKPIADAAADIFYERLFETTPELRSLFPAEMTDQKGKLMKTIGIAVNGLDRLDTIVPTVKALGAKHVKYGVRDTHYGNVGAALLFSLEVGLGDEWNPELKEAWTTTYSIVSSTMIAGAEEARALVTASDAAVYSTEPAPEPKMGIFAKIFSNA